MPQEPAVQYYESEQKQMPVLQIQEMYRSWHVQGCCEIWSCSEERESPHHRTDAKSEPTECDDADVIHPHQYAGPGSVGDRSPQTDLRPISGKGGNDAGHCNDEE